MKVLITGINGLLGSELVPCLEENHEVTGVCRNPATAACATRSLDITDRKAVYDAVTRINPDVIIHSAALSNVDECENNPDEAFKINCYGTRNLALACQRFDAALLYVSTDYVFSGRQHPAAGYTEFDATEPLSVYGTSKRDGEWMACHLLNKFYIVRTAWLFGKTRRNFIQSVNDSLAAGKYDGFSDICKGCGRSDLNSHRYRCIRDLSCNKRGLRLPLRDSVIHRTLKKISRAAY